MKRYYLLFLLPFVLVTTASAQNFLKNPGFEDWGSDGLPSFWTSSTNSCQKSTVTHSGSGAVKLVNSQIFGTSIMGAISQDSIRVSGSTFSVKGWYQLHPDGGDGLAIFIWIYGQGEYAGLTGANVLDIVGTKDVWTAFALGAVMTPGTTGDSAAVDFWIMPDSASDSWHPGTYVLLDDIVLDNTVTGVTRDEFTSPSNFSLSQNYPNPFNPSTQIEFTVPTRSHVTLKVYNIMGQEVKALIDQDLQAGRYKTDFDGSSLPSGTYLYRIQAGTFSKTSKMTLLK